MKTSSYILFLLLIPTIMTSCNNAQQTDVKNPLAHLNSEIKELKKANKVLSQELSSLEKNFKSLEFKYDQIVVLNDELKEWSASLVEGYGVGVWSFRGGENPIFYKKVETNDPKVIIREINRLLKTEKLPQIIFQEIKEKTVRVGISDDNYLTQEMGSFGPRSYFKAITYSLTSLEQIDCVEFDFEEGDHATPGKYCKEST